MSTYMKTITSNKRARYDYEIELTLNAGIVLSGHEVKSIRSGNVSLKGSYVTINQNEAWLINAHVGKYQHAQIDNYEPTQSRKLLLKKSEIRKIAEQKNNGRTAVPIRIGIVGNLIKVEIGIGPGKKLHDKRHTIKKRDETISIQKALKNQRG